MRAIEIKQTIAKKLIAQRRQILDNHASQAALACYVSPHGHSAASSEHASALQPWVEEEFLRSDTQVLLLKGAGGSGKTTFNQQLLHALWQDKVWDEFKPGDPPSRALAPIWIPLGSHTVDPERLFNYFSQLPEPFTEEEINILKSDYRLLLIADGYDEMPGSRQINLYDANQLGRYEGRVKLLISARIEEHAGEESTYFVPHRADGRLAWPLYKERYVAAFDASQRADYITQYLAKHKAEKDSTLWLDVAAYEHHFAEIPGIEPLLTTPFVLMMAVETLPSIMAEVKSVVLEDSKESKKKLEETSQHLVSELLLLDRDRELLPMTTKGAGDCAFHAILGVWDFEQKMLVCSDPKEKRQQIGKAIYEVADSKKNNRLRELSMAGIKELIMSGRAIAATTQILLQHYQQFLKDQDALQPALWDAFAKKLNEYPTILAYIEKHGHPKGQQTLRAKFYDALNEKEGELYGRLLSLPELNQAFRDYNLLRDVQFDWEAYLKQDAIKEYADFVSQPEQWLLPHELEIIAIVFNIKIVFYAHKDAIPQIFNEGQYPTVHVQFNGLDHYEQLQNVPKRTHMTLSFEQLYLTRSKLYDQFMAAWFSRQAEKAIAAEQSLKDPEKILGPEVVAEVTAQPSTEPLAIRLLKRGYAEFCQHLAQHLQMQGRSALRYPAEEKHESRLTKKIKEKESPKEQSVQPDYVLSLAKLFSKTADRTLIRQGCPLRQERSNEYSFLHTSFIDYFVTTLIYQQVTKQPEEKTIISEPPSLSIVEKSDTVKEKKVEVVEDTMVEKTVPVHKKGRLAKKTRPSNPLTQRLMARESIQFLADRVDQDEKFSNSLWDWIERSKTDEATQTTTAAANAITILSAANKSFSDKDFNGIRIPGADLTGGIFHGTQLRNADLTGVNFTDAHLEEVDFSGSVMKDIILNERPVLKGHSMPIRCMAYDRERDLAATGSGAKGKDCGICIWDIKQSQLIDILVGHTDEVIQVLFRPGQKEPRLISLSKDQTIREWDVKEAKELRKWLSPSLPTGPASLSTNGYLLALACESNQTLQTKNFPNFILSSQADIGQTLFEGSLKAKNPWLVNSSLGIAKPLISIWDLSTKIGTLAHSFAPHTGEISSLQWSPVASNLLVTSGANSQIKLWDLSQFAKPRLCWQQQFSNGYSRILMLSSEKKFPKEEHCDKTTIYLASHDDGWNMTALYWYPDENEYCRISLSKKSEEFKNIQLPLFPKFEEKPIEINTNSNSKLVDEITLRCGGCIPLGSQSLAFLPDGSGILVAEPEGIVIRAIKTGKSIRLYRLSLKNSIYSIAIDESGQYISAGDQENIEVCEAQSGHSITLLFGHNAPIQALAFSSQAIGLLFSASHDHTVRQWPIKRFSHSILNQSYHTRGITSLLLTPDEKTLISGSLDGNVQFWQPLSGRILKTQLVSKAGVTALTLTPDGNELIVGDGAGYIYRFSLKTGNKLAALKSHHDEAVTCLSVYQDKWKTQLASGSKDCRIILWDLQKDELIGKCETELLSPIQTLWFSHDGFLYSSDFRRGALQWTVASGKISSSSIADEKETNYLVGMPRRKTIVSAHKKNHEIRVWNLNPNQMLHAMKGHQAPITVINISQAGQIISGDEKGKVILWGQDYSPQAQLVLSSSVKQILIGPDHWIYACGIQDNNLLAYHMVPHNVSKIRLVWHQGTHFNAYHVTAENIQQLSILNREALQLPAESSALEYKSKDSLHNPNQDKRYALDKEGRTALIRAIESKNDQDIISLLQAGVYIDQAGFDDRTPLHIAVIRDHMPAFKILLDYKANVYQVDNEDRSPLFIASEVGHEAMVNALLKHKAIVNQANKYGFSPLYIASQQGHESVTTMLLVHQADVNQAGKKGSMSRNMSPLHIASQQGHETVVKALLKYKADINQVDQDGASSLCIASYNGHDTVVKTLLEYKAKVNQTNKSGMSSLLLASYEGREAVVKILLAHRAEVNQVGNGASSLFFASQQDHKTVVKTLLEHKAEVNKTTEDEGVSPLCIASQHGNEVIVKILLKYKARVNHTSKGRMLSSLYLASQDNHEGIVKILLGHKAEVNQVTKDGETPLSIASYRGHENIVSTLLMYGAEINQVQKDGASSLFVASQEGHEGVVKILLENKAEVNHMTKNGVSPLCIASDQNHETVAKTLLTHKAKVNQVNQDGESPLYIASKKGHDAVVKTLLEYKAGVNQTKWDSESSSLYIASAGGYEAAVNILIEYKADINQTNDECVSPLCMASYKGHETVVKTLLEHKAEINQVQKDGASSLFMASQQGQEGTVKMLLEYKAEVNQVRKSDGISLLYAACSNGNDVIIKTLLEYKADVNQSSNDGASPFLIASQQGHKRAVKTLLAHKADVNQVTTSGWSALHAAIWQGQGKIVKWLLNHNADSHLQTTRQFQQFPAGLTALEIAQLVGHTTLTILLKEHEASKGQKNLGDIQRFSTDRLEEKQRTLSVSPPSFFNELRHQQETKGEKIQSTSLLVASHLSSTLMIPQTKRDPTPEERQLLLWSIEKGDKSTLENLLKQGVYPDMINEDGDTLLNIAVTKKEDAITKLLLDYRATVNFQVTKAFKNKGKAPIHTAISAGNSSTVRLLLAYKAEVDLDSEEHSTPLIYAFNCTNHIVENDLAARTERQKNTYTIMKILLDNKADVNKQFKGTNPLTIAIGRCGGFWTCENEDVYRYQTAMPLLLIEYKADTTSLPPRTYSDLVGALTRNKEYTKVVKIFLENKLDVNQIYDPYGQGEKNTLFGKAVEYGVSPTVALLINYKANFNHRDVYNMTPIFYAIRSLTSYSDVVRYERKAIIRLLLEAGIDLSITAKKVELKTKQIDCTVVVYAKKLAEEYRWSSPYGPDFQEMAQLIEQYGKKQELLTRQLFDLIEKNNDSLIKNILEKKAVLTRVNKEGHSPLFVAAQKGFAQIVKLLLEYNAKVNQAKQPGLTALTTAAFRGHLEVVRTLLEAKANPTLETNSGETPLQYALKQGHHAVAALLQPQLPSVQESWREKKYDTPPIGSLTGSSAQSVPPAIDSKESSSSATSLSTIVASSNSFSASATSPAVSSGSSITDTPGTLFYTAKPSDSEIRQPLIPKPPVANNSRGCCLIL